MLDALAFGATSFVLLAAPGPTNALLASAGVTGSRGALSLLTAEAAGYVVAVAVLVLLAGPVLAQTPALVIVLKSAAAAWLLWTGLSFWRGSAQDINKGDLVRPQTVFVTTLLNPKSLVIAFGLMPPAAAGYQALIAHLAGLMTLTTLTGCIWIAGGAALGRAGATPYAARATAMTLGAFGVFILGSALRQ
jgi:threonine/homoserine/homoserine lactone efflux protein